MDQTMFLVPAKAGVKNSRAAIELIRESYGVTRSTRAPMNIGIICQSTKPIAPDVQIVLGIIPWN